MSLSSAAKKRAIKTYRDYLNASSESQRTHHRITLSATLCHSRDDETFLTKLNLTPNDLDNLQEALEKNRVAHQKELATLANHIKKLLDSAITLERSEDNHAFGIATHKLRDILVEGRKLIDVLASNNTENEQYQRIESACKQLDITAANLYQRIKTLSTSVKQRKHSAIYLKAMQTNPRQCDDARNAFDQLLKYCDHNEKAAFSLLAEKSGLPAKYLQREYHTHIGDGGEKTALSEKQDDPFHTKAKEYFALLVQIRNGEYNSESECVTKALALFSELKILLSSSGEPAADNAVFEKITTYKAKNTITEHGVDWLQEAHAFAANPPAPTAEPQTNSESQYTPNNSQANNKEPAKTPTAEPVDASELTQNTNLEESEEEPNLSDNEEDESKTQTSSDRDPFETTFYTLGGLSLTASAAFATYAVTAALIQDSQSFSQAISHMPILSSCAVFALFVTVVCISMAAVVESHREETLLFREGSFLKSLIEGQPEKTSANNESEKATA